jgi:hypothetical protein
MRKPGDPIAGFAISRPVGAAMPSTGRRWITSRAGLRASLMLVVLMSMAFSAPLTSRAIQDGNVANTPGMHVIHGIADAGPLDVYLDGSLALIGIEFTESSSLLAIPAGEHRFAVVSTGGSPEDAIASGTIALGDDTRYYATLLGTIDAASVGLFAIDERPLAAGQARFRVINGAPDAGEVVPVFTGGDALSEPLAFGDASQYAAIDAGVYDLDVLDAVSGAALLSLPQTPFETGVATDILVVGQLADGSLQALIEPRAVEMERPTGRTARIVAGTCADIGDLVAELGVVQPGQGEVVGVVGTTPVAQGFGLATAPFSSLISAPHAISVNEAEDAGGAVLACGEIGGRLTDTGALVVALDDPGGVATIGVAVLAPGLEDPETTGVSVFLAIDGTEDAAATPAAVAEISN